MGIFLSGMSDQAKRDAIAALPTAKRDAIMHRALPGARVDGQSLPNAIANAGADFRVETRPILAVLDAERAVEVRNRFATVRMDTGEPLGVVGNGYAVSQTLAQLAPVAVLVERGDAQLATVAVAKGGAKVRVSAFLGSSIIGQLPGSAGPDVLAHFGLFEASHDGESSTTGALQTLRVVCLNGLTTWDTVAKYSVRHTLNGEQRVAEAARLMLGLKSAAAAEVAQFQMMHQARMSLHQFRAFAHSLLEAARGKLASERAQAIRKVEVDDLCDLFTGGKGNSGSSLWDGYNSVTEWIDHRVRKNGAPAHTFESSRFGAGNALKSRALRMLTR